jgi:hypothetical protein
MIYWNNAIPGNGWAQLVKRWISAYPCVIRAWWYAADLNSKDVPTLPTVYNWHVLCNCSANRSYCTERYHPVNKPVPSHNILTYGTGNTVKSQALDEGDFPALVPTALSPRKEPPIPSHKRLRGSQNQLRSFGETNLPLTRIKRSFLNFYLR